MKSPVRRDSILNLANSLGNFPRLLAIKKESELVNEARLATLNVPAHDRVHQRVFVSWSAVDFTISSIRRAHHMTHLHVHPPMAEDVPEPRLIVIH